VPRKDVPHQAAAYRVREANANRPPTALLPKSGPFPGSRRRSFLQREFAACIVREQERILQGPIFGEVAAGWFPAPWKCNGTARDQT